jgi:hypothetical protein
MANGQKSYPLQAIWVPAVATFLSIIVTGLIYFRSNAFEVNERRIQNDTDSFNLKMTKLYAVKSIIDSEITLRNDSVKRLNITISIINGILADKSKSLNAVQRELLSLKKDSNLMADNLNKWHLRELKYLDMKQNIYDVVDHGHHLVSNLRVAYDTSYLGIFNADLELLSKKNNQ